MNRLRWLIAVPLLLGATTARGSEIRDKAGLFSREAVREAEASLGRAERETNVPVLIETIDSLGGETIGKASLDRARSSGIKGVYVLIAKDEHKVEARDFRNFLGEDRRRSIDAAFAANFKKGDFDGGLRAGVEAINEKITESGGPPKAQTAPARRGRVAVPPPPVGVRRGGGSSGLGVLLVIGLVILAVLIGLRLLGGLFRGAGGSGPGPMGRPGYGAPGYGGGYGGRGGGFFSGMLGGLGGAMAGNWLYDQFRGHRSGGDYANTGDVGYGGTEAAPPDAGNDWGGTSADWGGGDAGGGGGGDWGGGGGDWGGGGGDGGSW